MKLVVHKILNEDDFNIYLKYVESFDVINPFYKILGAKIDDVIDDKLRYFTLINDEKEVIILMPFLLRKIPCFFKEADCFDVISPYGYSGPLFNEDMSRGYVIMFWELVDAWYKENNIISEFIRFSLNNNFHFYSGILIPSLSNVRGAILDEEAQWSHLKQKVRTNYRKSTSNDLRINIIHKDIDSKDVEIFHDIYTSTMRRLNASEEYFYSFYYFNNIVRLGKGKALFAFVYKGDVPISAELLLISGNTVFSYLGGTLKEYFNCRPNDFLKIEVMKWARKNDFKFYVLGGGREDNDTLYHYKKSFFPNDQDVIFYTGRKIVNKKIYDKLSKIMNANVVAEEEEGCDKNDDGKIDYFPAYRKHAFNN